MANRSPHVPSNYQNIPHESLNGEEDDLRALLNEEVQKQSGGIEANSGSNGRDTSLVSSSGIVGTKRLQEDGEARFDDIAKKRQDVEHKKNAKAIKPFPYPEKATSNSIHRPRNPSFGENKTELEDRLLEDGGDVDSKKRKSEEQVQNAKATVPSSKRTTSKPVNQASNQIEVFPPAPLHAPVPSMGPPPPPYGYRGSVPPLGHPAAYHMGPPAPPCPCGCVGHPAAAYTVPPPIYGYISPPPPGWLGAYTMGSPPPYAACGGPPPPHHNHGIGNVPALSSTVKGRYAEQQSHVAVPMGGYLHHSSAYPPMPPGMFLPTPLPPHPMGPPPPGWHGAYMGSPPPYACGGPPPPHYHRNAKAMANIKPFPSPEKASCARSDDQPRNQSLWANNSIDFHQNTHNRNVSVLSQSHTDTQSLYWEIMNGGKEIDFSGRSGIDMKQVSKALSHPDLAVVSLSLARCRIDDDTFGSIHLALALNRNTTLTTLDLGGNAIDVFGAIGLADALKTNTALTTLTISYNEIGIVGARSLARALKTNATLNTLDLACSEVGEDGAIALAETLRENETLITLDLGGNAIGIQGANAFSQALITNATLTTLNLRRNAIGDVGSSALADALKTNAALNTLNLEDTSIGTDGALALAEALKANATLTTLDLDNNALGDDGFIALAEALKTNSTLTSLDLFSDEVLDCLEEDGRRLLDTVEQMTGRNAHKARLEPIMPAFVLGSNSEMVDVLAENTDSLSITFDLLRVRMSWVRRDGSSVGNHPLPVLEGPGTTMTDGP